MSAPALTFLALAGDAAGALPKIPSGPGVGQIVSAEGRSLVVGVASSLRRWAASQLGLGRKPAPGRRPKLDLSVIAAEIGWIEADGPFRQRLLYERLMGPLVPLSARRDLAPPLFLHLDPSERFPRVTIRGREGGLGGLFGPFRTRGAAEKARDALHRLFPLRPCDESFEPDPALALGRACLFAQVRSCAAPCLQRVGEDEYRVLAERAAAWLSDPWARRQGPRPEGPTSTGAGREDPAVPAIVSAAAAWRALVLDPSRKTIGLYPVRSGQVLEDAAITTSPEGLDAAVDRLAWPDAEGPDDWPWLLAWLRGPRRSPSCLLSRGDEEPAALASRVRAALPARFGGTLGSARGEG